MTTATATTAYASESGHFYWPDGRPCYTIVGKNGKERPTHVGDAKKHGLRPSTTTITKQAAAPGLEAWKRQQLLLAAMTLPKQPQWSEDQYIKQVVMDSNAQANAAAERGNQIHGAIERFYLNQGISEQYALEVMATQAAIATVFGHLKWSAEKSFACSDFGCRIDLLSDDGNGVVLDIKSKDFDDSKPASSMAYDEHCMQLAANRHCAGVPNARCGNVFVSRDNPGIVKIHLWEEEELQRGFQMFNALKDYFYAKTELPR